MSRRIAIAAALMIWAASLAHAQTARTVRDRVYTDAQAARGQTIYLQQCAACHGAKLDGLQGPPLVGDAFLRQWHTQPLSDLAGKIRNTMPAGAAGTLTPQQSVDLVAFILKTGGFPAGTTELASDDTALAAITWPAGLVAAAPASTTQGKIYPPLGNMAQLMRGIFFPNSNLIFTVQTRDPGAPAKPTADNPNAGFSFVDWGAGIYGGWELVDNAALALADASPLMLAPGIRCENGRLAPVTEDLIAVARRTYRLSQTRNQEAVAEATGDLSDACAACHQVYRETRGRGGRAPDPRDPSNKAGRCMPRPSTTR